MCRRRSMPKLVSFGKRWNPSLCPTPLLTVWSVIGSGSSITQTLSLFFTKETALLDYNAVLLCLISVVSPAANTCVLSMATQFQDSALKIYCGVLAVAAEKLGALVPPDRPQAQWHAHSNNSLWNKTGLEPCRCNCTVLADLWQNNKRMRIDFTLSDSQTIHLVHTYHKFPKSLFRRAVACVST